VSSPKTELVLHQAELESERQDRQTAEQALRAQVIETGKRKAKVMAAIQEASEKAESLKRESVTVFRVLFGFFASSLLFSSSDLFLFP
jgi:hypothetical protein